jgi:hypothetical protein
VTQRHRRALARVLAKLKAGVIFAPPTPLAPAAPLR